MDNFEKAFFAWIFLGVFGFLAFLIFCAAGAWHFNSIEVRQKDRELEIREKEIELKAQQYPYKTETKLEITAP